MTKNDSDTGQELQNPLSEKSTLEISGKHKRTENPEKQGSKGVDVLAYAAAGIILGVRGIINSVNIAMDWAINGSIRKFRAWEPKSKPTQALKKGLAATGNKLAAGYKRYNDFFAKRDYPSSAAYLGALGAGAAGVFALGFTKSHEAMHAITTGHATLASYVSLPFYFVFGKCSNVLTIKPAIKLAATTRDGFFESDLYQQKLKPVYIKHIDPWVQLTRKHVREFDDFIAREVSFYREFKNNLNDKETLMTRAKAIADKNAPELAKSFASAIIGRTTKKARDLLGITPYGQIGKPSKLDSQSAKDKFKRAQKGGSDKTAQSYNLTNEPGTPDISND